MRYSLSMIIKNFFSFSASKLRSVHNKLKQKMVHAKKQKQAAVNNYLLPRVDIVIRYIEVDFTFGLLDYIRYSIEEFGISRFYSIHFTVTLAGT